MPRTARASLGDVCYHVLNRGNGRMRVFRREADYAAFLKLIDDAATRLPLRVLSYCLMPNHFHLVLWLRAATAGGQTVRSDSIPARRAVRAGRVRRR